MDIVQIRNVEPSDLPIFFEHQRDPVAVTMAGFFSRDRDAFDAHWKKISADPKVHNQTIEYGRVVAGYVATWEIEGQRYVAYWLGKAFWGKGIATQALTVFLKRDPRPLQANVAKTNIGSIRVLEKCGFQRIGENTDPLRPGGEAIEEWIYERIPPEAPGQTGHP